MTLEELSNECWTLMRPAFFRRAILGRRRCDELVMHIVAAFPDAKFSSKEFCSALERSWKARLPEVRGKYEAVFRVIVLPWAIRGIVTHVSQGIHDKRLVIKTIRRHYGWM